MPDQIIELAAGTPSGLFRKDVIRVGHYRHPVTGQTVDVDVPRLRRWESNFNAMKALGQPVKAAKGHNIMDPLGDVVNMSVDTADPAGPALIAEMRFADPEAVQYARRAGQVSATIIPEWLSNAGQKLLDVIHYIAVTPDPVVPGSPFIALSRITEPKGQENTAMLEKLAKLLGCDATEEAVVAAVEKLYTAHGSAVAAHASAAKAHESAAAAHSQALDRVAGALGCEADAAKIEAAAKALKDAKPAPAVVELSREGKIIVGLYGDKLAALVAAGSLNQAAADALKPLLVGCEEIRLARDGELEHVAKVIAALALNVARPAAAHGSKTGAQLPAGSRTVQMSRDPEAEGKAADTKARADGLKAEITKRAARK